MRLLCLLLFDWCHPWTCRSMMQACDKLSVALSKHCSSFQPLVQLHYARVCCQCVLLLEQLLPDRSPLHNETARGRLFRPTRFQTHISKTQKSPKSAEKARGYILSHMRFQSPGTSAGLVTVLVLHQPCSAFASKPSCRPLHLSNLQCSLGRGSCHSSHALPLGPYPIPLHLPRRIAQATLEANATLARLELMFASGHSNCCAASFDGALSRK